MPRNHPIFTFLLWIFVNTAYANTSTAAINTYINNNWKSLERSVADCNAYVDKKIIGPPTLYLPFGFKIDASIRAIKSTCHINIVYLPKQIKKIDDIPTTNFLHHGLLYLPRSYVVPGGRFNEMYGWDSYFIILGLIESQQRKLAENILENYFFEIKYYGGILNANRTYHLSRSQPPFLTSAILALLPYHQNETSWLQRAYFYAKLEHQQWLRAPFLAGDTGLSRYFDKEQGPLIEAKTYGDYYPKVYAYIKSNPDKTENYLDLLTHALSKHFYQGERSLRASGFDITNRFGPFGGNTQDYAPVCLNSLLYKTEIDLATLAKRLNKNKEAIYWLQLAHKRQKNISKFLYNNKRGIFVDYNFVKKQQSNYAYITTFYPLWAGLANPTQALAVVQHLFLFEAPYGLATSDQITGLQWDKPFGWAPMQLIAVEGMERYGFKKEGYRIARKFNSVILLNFAKTGSIYEKYNVVDGQTHTAFLGYRENVIGFGWTNATYLLFQKLQN